VLDVELNWNVGSMFIEPKISFTSYKKEVGMCKRISETKVVKGIYQYHSRANGFSITAYGSTYSLTIKTSTQQSLSWAGREKAVKEIPEVLSPMPGTVLSVRVKKGMRVSKNEEICIMEAMKMQNIIKSPRDGMIKQVHVAAGDRLSVDQAIITFVK
jgi:propionyl-CoA carboxylase alpha chain